MVRHNPIDLLRMPRRKLRNPASIWAVRRTNLEGQDIMLPRVDDPVFPLFTFGERAVDD